MGPVDWQFPGGGEVELPPLPRGLSAEIHPIHRRLALLNVHLFAGASAVFSRVSSVLVPVYLFKKLLNNKLLKTCVHPARRCGGVDEDVDEGVGGGDPSIHYSSPSQRLESWCLESWS